MDCALRNRLRNLAISYRMTVEHDYDLRVNDGRVDGGCRSDSHRHIIATPADLSVQAEQTHLLRQRRLYRDTRYTWRRPSLLHLSADPSMLLGPLLDTRTSTNLREFDQLNHAAMTWTRVRPVDS